MLLKSFKCQWVPGVQRRGRCEETGEREEKEVKKRGRQVGGNELHPAKYNVYFCLSLSLFSSSCHYLFFSLID